MAKKRTKRRQPRSPKRESTVEKFPIESDAARDEGPRLIPLPSGMGTAQPGLASDSYVSLAEKAIKLWEKADSKAADNNEPKRTNK